MKTYKGTFDANTSTGNQAITGLGFQPKVVMLWTGVQRSDDADGVTVNAKFAFGAASAATERGAVAFASTNGGTNMETGRAADSAALLRILSNGVPTTDAVADLVSLDSDGFTINWSDAPSDAWQIHFLALGGTDITNAKVGNFTAQDAGATQSVTDPGFQPDCVIFFSVRSTTTGQAHAQMMIGAATDATHEWSFLAGSPDGVATATTYNGQESDACIQMGTLTSASFDAEANLASMDANGFTLNWVNLPSATTTVYYIALQGGSYFVGMNDSPVTNISEGTTGVGFEPAAVLFANCTSSADGFTTTGTGCAALEVGGTDGTRQGCAAWLDNDGSGTQRADSSNFDDRVMWLADPGGPTTQATATLSTLDSDGFTISWTDTTATAWDFGFIAFGPPEASDLTIAPTGPGAATAGGPSAGIAVTIGSGAGGATAAGADATLRADIGSGIGAAVGQGPSASLQATLDSGVGGAVAGGPAPSIAVGPDVPSAGGAAAVGADATLAYTHAGTPGGAVADGPDATLTVTLDSAAGAAVADGPDATVSLVLLATAGGAVGGGNDAQVASDVNVQPSPGGSVGGGPATELSVTLDAPSPGASTADGGDATVSLTVPAAPGGAVADGLDATVSGAGDLTLQPAPGAAAGAGNEAQLTSTWTPGQGAAAAAGPSPIVAAVMEPAGPGSAAADGNDGTLAFSSSAQAGGAVAGGPAPTVVAEIVPGIGVAVAAGLDGTLDLDVEIFPTPGGAVAGGHAGSYSWTIPDQPSLLVSMAAMHLHAETVELHLRVEGHELHLDQEGFKVDLHGDLGDYHVSGALERAGLSAA